MVKPPSLAPPLALGCLHLITEFLVQALCPLLSVHLSVYAYPVRQLVMAQVVELLAPLWHGIPSLCPQPGPALGVAGFEE